MIPLPVVFATTLNRINGDASMLDLKPEKKQVTKKNKKQKYTKMEWFSE